MSHKLGFDSLITFAVNICIWRQLSGWGGVGTAKVLVSYPACGQNIVLSLSFLFVLKGTNLPP